MEKYKVNGQMTDQGAQRREEQLAAVGEKILKASRSALYLKMRFLDVALCSLFFCARSGCGNNGYGRTGPLLLSGRVGKDIPKGSGSGAAPLSS